MSIKKLFLVAAALTAATVFAFQNRDEGRLNYAIVKPDGSITGSWSSQDFKNLSDSKVERLVVRRDGKLYEITDPATVQAAEAAFGPVEELGRQQGALGRQQGELGRRQGDLGRQQGALGRQQGELGRLQGELARVSEEERSRAEAARKMREMEGRMRELANQQRALGEKQSALGRDQSALGRKQSELGRRQSEASKLADAKVRALIDTAFGKHLEKQIGE